MDWQSHGRLARRSSAFGRQCLSGVLALAFVLAGAGPSQAIVIRHDVAQSNYTSLSASFAAVGRISSSNFSSGTLVSSTKFLTAAHSVDGNRDGIVDNALNTYRIRFGANTSSNATADYTISSFASISIHPQWSLTNGNRTFDLAVVTLTNPFTQITPISLSNLNPSGMTGTMVGYGGYATGNNAATLTYDNIRRAANNVVDVSSNATVRTDFDSPSGNTSTLGSAVPLALEGTTAPGDSGGPLLVDFGSGARLIGVLSGGFQGVGGVDYEYGDVSIYAPINNDVNISYLATQGIPVPEPGVLATALVGLAVGWGLRRKSRSRAGPRANTRDSS